MTGGSEKEDGMLNAFGVFAGAVGLAVVVWFFYVGFLVKKIVKEQAETNRLLRNLAPAAPPVETAKAA
jgi:hypothetical protein